VSISARLRHLESALASLRDKCPVCGQPRSAAVRAATTFPRVVMLTDNDSRVPVAQDCPGCGLPEESIVIFDATGHGRDLTNERTASAALPA
jgi:hypothetical protein